MKQYCCFLCLLCFLMFCGNSLASPLKPRVIVLTDISTWETDDHESLIRLLAHADMFEIEGLIISTGYSIETLTKSPEKDFINIAHGVVDAYEKDLSNLMKRSNQVGHQPDGARQHIGYWPSPQYLRGRTMFGSLHRGKQYIGDDNDSPGSELIIRLADEDDSRPVWVTVWGGGNTLAQSIYRVQKDRSPEQFKTFLRKLRVYAITDQDRHYDGSQPLGYSAHGWLREQTGSELRFIWDECAWKAHNGTGRSNWDQYATHIQGHGHLGSQYPKYKYGVEGDTPAFLYLMPMGLNDPEDPTQCSWGGNYSGDANNLWHAASSCRGFFDRFYPAAFNNFAARMDWAKEGTGNRNPVIVLDGDDGVHVLTKTPQPGTAVTLDASQTSDPDGDNLTFRWWIQSDAGTYPGPVNITNNSSSIATVNVPSDTADKTFHVICEVTDNGTHNLTSYRRVIFRPALARNRPRVMVTSDGEIDDECSLVRFLLYANEWDIEAIITSSSQYHWQGHRWPGDDWAQPYLEAYAQVYPNLLKHDAAYPTPRFLQERTLLGNVKAEGEMEEVTPGSQRIVEVLLDDSDPRPIWIQAWGGTNTIARALQTIEQEHPEKMIEVARKIRFYCIWEQDNTYQRYIRPHWGKHGIQTIIADQFIAIFYHWKKYLPADQQRFLAGSWMKAHILENHGPLCCLYQAHQQGDKGFEGGDFRSEGDSPAFLHTVPTGLRSMESPAWGGWGGRFVKVRENTWLDPVLEPGYQYPQGRWYGNSAWGRTRLKKAIPNDRELTAYLKPQWRWIDALQNDFAARADWCVKPYDQANHPPVVTLAHAQDLTARPGDKVSLSAGGTSDPDGDILTYRWWQYEQADTYDGTVAIEKASFQEAWLIIPNDAAPGQTIHIICEVTDRGTPPLTRYRRIVVNIE